jgi:membrane protein
MNASRAAAAPSTPRSVREILNLFKEAAAEWSEDKAPRLGAAISYYTVFSLAPLLLISIAVAGFVVGGDTARTGVIDAMGGLIGEDGGKAIESMIDNAAKNTGRGIFATIIGVVMLLFGASGVFVELQDSLNTVWGVVAKPDQGIRGFVRHRVMSFAMVLGIGFLLLVSLVITALLGAMGEWMSASLPGGAAVWQLVNVIVSLGVVAFLFAMIFKLVPDVRLTWRDVAVGAVVTAVLFSVGKLLIGLYLGKSSTASVFGAAGSLAILFIWIYYSAQIMLYGAEFTQVWANKYGSHLLAGPNALLKEGAVPVAKQLGAAAREEGRPDTLREQKRLESRQERRPEAIRSAKKQEQDEPLQEDWRRSQQDESLREDWREPQERREPPKRRSA